MTTHQRRRATGLVAAAVALIVTGCTASPQAQPPASTPPSSSAKLPSSAPPVSKSWDASSYRDKPCALFTDDQAKVLGYLKPGSFLTSESDSGATICLRADGGFIIKYYYSTDLLGKIYRREITFPGVNSASPIPIAGQPALRPAAPITDTCTVAVGLADTQGFSVRIEDKTINPCDRAVTIAETIMHNLGA